MYGEVVEKKYRGKLINTTLFSEYYFRVLNRPAACFALCAGRFKKGKYRCKNQVVFVESQIYYSSCSFYTNPYNFRNSGVVSFDCLGYLWMITHFHGDPSTSRSNLRIYKVPGFLGESTSFTTIFVS